MEWRPGARIRDHKNALELRTGLVLADNMLAFGALEPWACAARLKGTGPANPCFALHDKAAIMTVEVRQGLSFEEGSNARSTSPALLVCHEGVRWGSQLSGTTSGENLLRFKGMQMPEKSSPHSP
jgi:hypothetical protein